MKKRSNRINCLDRALDILEAFTDAQELGVSEIAHRLNLHIATTYNLIKTLTLRHYLLNINGRYRLGPKFKNMATSRDTNLPLPQLLDPFVHELSQVTGENTGASVLVGFQAKMIIDYRGSGTITANSFSQALHYPMDLATGRALLAFGPEILWEHFIIRYQKHYPADKTTKDEWIAMFRTIRTNFLAEIRNPGNLATSGFAAPVLDINGKVLAAIGVSCPNISLTEQRIASMKQETTRLAREASSLFGGGS